VNALRCSEEITAIRAALNRVNSTRTLSLLMSVGVETGLRISDLLALKVSQLTSGRFTLTEKKNKNVREFVLLPDTYDFYTSYVFLNRLKKHHFLFFSSRKGFPLRHKPMSRQWAARIFARTASRMQIKHFSTHSMRKTFACRLFASTGRVDVVQRALGHKHLSTTLIYLKDLLLTALSPN
jgi:integrase